MVRRDVNPTRCLLCRRQGKCKRFTVYCGRRSGGQSYDIGRRVNGAPSQTLHLLEGWRDVEEHEVPVCPDCRTRLARAASLPRLLGFAAGAAGVLLIALLMMLAVLLAGTETSTIVLRGIAVLPIASFGAYLGVRFVLDLRRFLRGTAGRASLESRILAEAYRHLPEEDPGFVYVTAAEYGAAHRRGSRG